MQDEKIDNQAQANKRELPERRIRRIRHIKTSIIVITIVLLVLPTLLCVYLGTQIWQLQKQVEIIADLHKSELQDAPDTRGKDGDDKVAYAAERTEEDDSDTEFTNNSDEEGDQDRKPTDSSDEARDLDMKPLDKTENKEPNSNNPEVGAKDEGPQEVMSEAPEKDAEVPTKAEEIVIHENGIYEGIEVYLTFDDGPSIYTDDILDILKDYETKATFFVVGKTDEESKRLYRRIVEEGHSLGIHSYSHIYKEIYHSVEDFDKDFTKLRNLLYDITGYMPMIYRFPGGSSSITNNKDRKKYIKYLYEKSTPYYDWNVDNGDATGIPYTKEQLVDNVLQGVKGKNRAIVLMHDVQTKKTTVESLPALLEGLISQGALLLPLDEEVEPIQQIKAK